MEMPAILTARTYFWSPGLCASTRRSHELRQHTTVADWLRSLGFRAISHIGSPAGGTTVATGIVRDHAVTCTFYYRESCNHVYRRCTWTIDGKKTTLTRVRRLL